MSPGMRLLKFAPALALAAGLLVLAWPRSERGYQDELRIVSPHWEGIREEFTWAFEEHWKAKTGRRVRVLFLDLGGTSKCMRYIRSTRPGQTGADLVFGGGVDNYLRLAGEGYLEPVEVSAEVLGEIPPEIHGYPVRDTGNRWFSACLATFGISFNREVLAAIEAPEPREWRDLADPRYFKWIGMGEPRSSGTVHIVYELILQSYGWREGFALLTRIGGNARTFTEGGNGIPRGVAMGEFAAGGAIDFYALEKVLRLGPEKMGYAAPQRMPVINGDPVALLAGAPNREAAEEFVKFVLSERGQKIWYLKPGEKPGPRRFALGRLPVWAGLYESAGPDLAGNNPYKAESIGKYDFRKVGRRWTALDALIGAAILDPHAELQRAWKALIDEGLPAEGLRQLGAPPFSEEEFMRWADWFNDRKVLQSEKNDKVAEWGTWARAKYARVRAGCAKR